MAFLLRVERVAKADNDSAPAASLKESAAGAQEPEFETLAFSSGNPRVVRPDVTLLYSFCFILFHKC